MDCSSSRIPSIIIIEEPENNLHPKYQKLLPKLFSEISSSFNNHIQFFVATHSPFIISAAAGLENQKVYLLENGQTVDLDGALSKGENGYEVLKQANKMLGAGLEDLHKKVVICEGQPNNRWFGFDAEIYNTIFYKEKYLFVSAGGETQLVANAELSQRVLKNLFAGSQSIAFYLKDGDNKTEKVKKNEIVKHEKYGELKFLERYGLENYLLDPKIVLKLYPETQDYQQKYEEWLGQEKSYHGLFLKKLLDAQKERNQFYLELAKLITPDTEVYKELYNLLFGDK